MIPFDSLKPALLARAGLTVAVLCALATDPARAQVGEDPDPYSPSYEQRDHRTPSYEAPSSGSSPSIPDWAEPAEPAPTNQSVQPNVGPPCPGGNCGGGEDPTREEIPLGGLEWLLAAGFGYGFWKLREE